MNENNNMMNNTPPQGAVPPPQNGVPYGQAAYGPMPYNPYYQSPSYVKPIKEPIVFSKKEKIFAVAAAVLAYLFIQFVLWNITGYFTTAFYFLILSCVTVYLNKSGFKFSASHKFWDILMYIFSTVFSITANTTIKTLNVIFLQLGTAYLIYSVTHESKLFGRFAVPEILKSSVADPMSHFDKEFSALGSSLKDTNSGKNIKSVLIGIIFAVPLTIVVAALLASADAGIEKMFRSVFDSFNTQNIMSTVGKLIFTIPAAGYLFGLLYSQTHKDKTKQLTEEYCENSIKNARKIPNAAMYVAVTPICLLYVLFFISQINYFFSAFRGILPEEYDYSQYARRGFFELFAIELINAAVIFFINFFSQKTGEEKPAALKVYTLAISVFTLLITATAISKMAMYISNCGLTQLRVYTTWFMVLTAIMFIYIIIRQFKRDFSVIRPAAATFILMFGLLCFSRPDAFIARYNFENKSDVLSFRDVEIMSDMSLDSAAVVVSPEYADIVERLYYEDNPNYRNYMYDREIYDPDDIDDENKSSSDFVKERIRNKYHLNDYTSNKRVYNKFNLSYALISDKLD